MKESIFYRYIAPYAGRDNQFRRDPNFQIFSLLLVHLSKALYRQIYGVHQGAAIFFEYKKVTSCKAIFNIVGTPESLVIAWRTCA